MRQSSDFQRTATLQATGAAHMPDDDEDDGQEAGVPLGAAGDKGRKDNDFIANLRQDSFRYNDGASFHGAADLSASADHGDVAAKLASAQHVADEAARDAAAGGGSRESFFRDSLSADRDQGRTAAHELERTGALGPGAYQKINRTPPTGIVSAAPDVEYEYPELSLKELKRLDSLSQHMDLVCTLESAANLPKADTWGTIDPYITMTIVEGNPLAGDYNGPTKQRGYANPVYGYAKSSMKIQNQNPNWEQVGFVILINS